jgi:hypothetical protein
MVERSPQRRQQAYLHTKLLGNMQTLVARNLASEDATRDAFGARCLNVFVILVGYSRFHHPFPVSQPLLIQDGSRMNASLIVSFLISTSAAGAQTSSPSVGYQEACFCVILSHGGPHVPHLQLHNTSRLGGGRPMALQLKYHKLSWRSPPSDTGFIRTGGG